MVNMMRDNIYFFRNYFQYKILCENSPEAIAESISSMSTVTVIPDRAVSSHDDHTIDKCSDQKFPGKEFKDEKKEKWKQDQD